MRSRKGRPWERSLTQPEEFAESAAFHTCRSRSRAATSPAVGPPRSRGCARRTRNNFISSLHDRILAGSSRSPLATRGRCPHTPEIFGAIGVHRGWEGKVAIVKAQSQKPKTFAAATGSVVTGKSQRRKNCIRGNRNPHGRRDRSSLDAPLGLSLAGCFPALPASFSPSDFEDTPNFDFIQALRGYRTPRAWTCCFDSQTTDLLGIRGNGEYLPAKERMQHVHGFIVPRIRSGRLSPNSTRFNLPSRLGNSPDR